MARPCLDNGITEY